MKLTPGGKVGSWTLISYEPGARAPKAYPYWLCRCDCGTERKVLSNNLMRGITESCGCVHRDAAKLRTTTHGLSHTKVWYCWTHLRDRCTNPNLKDFHRYGGRGITYAPEWEDFASFYAYVGDPPSEKHTIDRIDVNGNYEPGNVRWATYTQQNRNRRDNTLYTYRGESKVLAEWAPKYGINLKTLSSRIYQMNWDFQEALLTPVRQGNYATGPRRKTKLFGGTPQ